MTLTTLSRVQADYLAEARDTPGGVYVPLTGRAQIATELVDGGAAEYREDRQQGGTKGPHDLRPCTWTDYYIVPTALGLRLLAARPERA